MPAYDWITLTTDFGLSDGYAGILHGVIAQHAPWVRVIDITHLVPPGEVSRGAAVLQQAVGHLPRAVHVGVVDPGVGSARRAVGLHTARGVLVGPDNGLLTGAADALGGIETAVRLAEPSWFLPEVSQTFHGRDVFAPVAARLAAGVPLTDAGPAIDPDSLVRLPEPIVELGDGYLEAEVLTVDRFGNVQLAAAGPALDGLGGQLLVGGVRATRAGTFAGGQPGQLIVYVDSMGKVAVAINGGRAVVALAVGPGDILRLTNA